MKFHNIVFVNSAINKEQWPKHDYNEICLAGRSNVGKSSFINTIFNRRKMAYVGKKPGKTQLLNFFTVDDCLSIVDVPGYGYANRSQQYILRFSKMMEEYFNYRENLKLLILLVDIRHKPTKDDITMIEFVKALNINYIVVANKYDKCKKSVIDKNIKLISDVLKIDKNNIFSFSCISRYGYDIIYRNIDLLKN